MNLTVGIGLWEIAYPMTTITPLQDWQEIQNASDTSNIPLFLTEDKVRNFPHLKAVTTEEVENVIITLHELALISYQMFCLERSENKPVIEMG